MKLLLTPMFRALLLVVAFFTFTKAEAQSKQKFAISYDSVFVSMKDDDSSEMFKQRIIAFKNNRLYDFIAEGPLQLFTSVEMYTLIKDSATSYNHFNYYNITTSKDTNIPFNHIQNTTDFVISGDIVYGDDVKGFEEEHFIIRKKSVYTINAKKPITGIRLNLYYNTLPLLFVENQIYPDTLILNKDIYFSRKTHYAPITIGIIKETNNTLLFNGIRYKRYTALNKFQKDNARGNVKTMISNIRNRNISLLGIR